jgi:hypothetical protein
MTIKFDELEHYCSAPEEQMNNIQYAFQQTVSLSDGHPLYKPRLALFNSDKELIFSISAKDYSGLTEYKSAIAEMLYSFSAFNSHSCILVLDSNVTEGDKVIGDCLNLYFISSTSCHMVQLMYKIEASETTWLSHDHRFSSIDLKDHETVSHEMVEMLFVFTHLDSSPFTSRELLSYYSLNNYQFRSFKDFKTSYVDFKFVQD